MPKLNIQDTNLRSLRPPKQGSVDYWDTKFAGFGVRVSQGGTKTFILNLHKTRKSLGRFPIISLADARAEAKRILAEKTLGKVRPQSITFPQAVKLFLEDKTRSRRPRTVQDYTWLLDRHFPFKGQITDISYTQLLRQLDKLKHTPSQYNHTLTCAKIFFNWCKKRRYISDNPLFGLSPHHRPSRSRVLTDDEIKSIWNCTGKFADYIKLLLLLGQRRGELRQAVITADTLTIPASVSKNGRESVIPLTPFAAQLFTHFPNFAWTREKRNLDIITGTYGWTLHDCRRTFATRLADLGTPPHVIERCLNHISGQISGVSAVYNRATYLPEMREALTSWENRLQEIVR